MRHDKTLPIAILLLTFIGLTIGYGFGADLKPGVGYTPLSHVTMWRNHDGTTHTGILNSSVQLTTALSSIDARYGAGASQRWFWALSSTSASCDNEHLGDIAGNAMRSFFTAGTLGSPTVYDGQPTVQEENDACATGDVRVLSWAMTVAANTTPVPMSFPHEPCGVFVRVLVPGQAARPVLNTSTDCVSPVISPHDPGECVPVTPAPPTPCTPAACSPVACVPVVASSCVQWRRMVGASVSRAPSECVNRDLVIDTTVDRVLSTGKVRVVVVPESVH